jgi:hypothetical protein
VENDLPAAMAGLKAVAGQQPSDGEKNGFSVTGRYKWLHPNGPS